MSESDDDEIFVVDIEKELLISHIESINNFLVINYKKISLNRIKLLEKIFNNLETRASLFYNLKIPTTGI